MHERSRKDARKLFADPREVEWSLFQAPVCGWRIRASPAGAAGRYAATTMVLTVAVTSSVTSTTTMYVPV